MRHFRSLCLALTLGLPITPAAAQPLYRLAATVPLGGPVKWDYLKTDAPHHRLFISHGDEETVVDLQSLKVIGQLTGLPGSHGVAIDPATGDIWADSAKKSQAIAFDPVTFKRLAAVPVVQDADGMDYDPASKTIFVSGGDGQAMTPINPATRQAYPDIPLPGSPESFVVDGKGALYVNIIDKNEIIRIDTKTREITAHWPTPACIAPTGLAMDRTKRLLFTSCRGGSMDVLNADTGAVVATFLIGKGTDSAAYDPVRQRAFSANGDGTLSVIGDSAAPRLLATVPTMPGARTMAVDPGTGDVLTVTARITSMTPATKPGGHPHDHFAPGTLKLLVYAPAP